MWYASAFSHERDRRRKDYFPRLIFQFEKYPSRASCATQKMVNCCVPGCTNYSQKTKGQVSYHRFPEDNKLRRAWINRIRRENLPPLENCYVCSKHFLPEELESDLKEELTGRKSKPRLKRNAIPSKFDFVSQKKPRPASVNRSLKQSQSEVGSDCAYNNVFGIIPPF